MCGIVGIASSWLAADERDIFKDLLVVSNLRGWQGAGVITARNNCADPMVFKTVASGLDLAHDPEFNKDIYHRKDNRAPAVLIGHTRWPTKGAVSLETTHPHVHNGIYGVHNGTIDYIDGKYVTKDESDSALLYHAIGEQGVQKVIPTVRGAYALVWLDDQLKTLNFLRNDKRPLHFAVTTTGTIVWASEAAMLRFVLGRRGIKYELSELPVDKWHQLEMPLAHNHKNTKLEIVDLKGKAPEVASSTPFLVRGTASGAGGTTTGTHISQTATSGAAQTTPKLAIQGPAYLRTYFDMETQRTLKELSFEKRETLVYDSALARWYKPVRKASVITLSGGEGKPRKTWDHPTKNWVDIEGTTTTITKSSGETKDLKTTTPPSTESNAVNNLDKIFDLGGDDDEDIFKQTKENCWVSPSQYAKLLDKGCCWCGDTPERTSGILWVSADEFMCQVCRDTDDYARQYCADLYGVQITTMEEDLDRKLKDAVAA